MTEIIPDWEREDCVGISEFTIEQFLANHKKIFDDIGPYKEFYIELLTEVYNEIKNESVVYGLMTLPACIAHGKAIVAVSKKMSSYIAREHLYDEKKRKKFYSEFVVELKSMLREFGRVWIYQAVLPMGSLPGEENYFVFATRFAAQVPKDRPVYKDGE